MGHPPMRSSVGFAMLDGTRTDGKTKAQCRGVPCLKIQTWATQSFWVIQTWATRVYNLSNLPFPLDSFLSFRSKKHKITRIRQPANL